MNDEDPTSAIEACSEADTVRLYRLIVESLPDMVWTVFADGRPDYFNARVLEYTGLDRAELDETLGRAVVHPDERAMCRQRWRRALETGEHYRIECRLRRHDGSYRWHLVSALPLRDAAGRIVRWVGTCTDIQAQKRAEQTLERSQRELEELVAERTAALGESERRFRSFVENVPALTWIKDAQGRFTFVNRNFTRYLARPEEELLGLTAHDLWPPEVARRFAETDERVMVTGELQRYTESLPDRDGRVRHWMQVKFPLSDAQGETGVAGMAIEITEQVEAQRELQRSTRRVRELLHRLIAAQEAERRRLASELHDLLGQNLTALKIGLETLQERIGAGAAERLGMMSRLLQETVDSIREVTSNLRPTVLDDCGLLAALRWHAERFERRTGLRIAVQGDETGLRLPRESALALFRIAQEALANAARHSGGSQARVVLERSPARLTLSINDNGHGFAESAETRAGGRGWGLSTMRERAEALGGTLRLESSAAGTCVVVSVPVPDGDPSHSG